MTPIRRGLAVTAGAGLLVAGLAGTATAATTRPSAAGQAPRATTVPPAGDPFVATVNVDGSGITWTDTRTRATGTFTGIPNAYNITVSPQGGYVTFDYDQGTDDPTTDQFGVGVVNARTGAVTQLTQDADGSDQPPSDDGAVVNATEDTVAFIHYGDATTIETVPIGGGTPTDTGVATGGVGALAYAPDGGIYYTSTDASCGVSEHPTSGADTCVVTTAQLDQADGGSGTAVTGLGVSLASGKLVVVGTVPSGTDADGNPGPSTDVVEVVTPAASGSPTVTTLPATAAVDAADGTSYDEDYSPTLDPTGTEVIYEEAAATVDSAGDLTSSTFTAWSVDVPTGTHRASVLVAAPNDLGPSGVGSYVPADTPEPSVFVPLAAPVRVLDTRKGTGAKKAPVAAGTPVDVDVTKGTGIPATASAVVANVTGTDVTKPTYLQLYPTPASSAAAFVPNVSDLNLVRGQTAANAVTVAVSGGSVRVANAVGSADVLLDVTGYYLPLPAFQASPPEGSSTFHPATVPTRVVDTRNGTGVTKATLGPNSSVDWTVPTGTVPDNASSVVLDVGGISKTAPTFVTAFPAPTSGTAAPTTSSVSLAKGETRANLTTVTLPASRAVRFYNAAGSTDVFADLVGYYTNDPSGSLFVPLAPSRIFDSRSGMNEVGGAAKITGGTSTAIRAVGSLTTGTGQNTVAADATAVQVNLTAANETAPTFLSLSTSTGKATFSSLNAPRATNIANGAITAVSPAGEARIYSDQGKTDAIVDLAGYFVPVPLD